MYMNHGDLKQGILRGGQYKIIDACNEQFIYEELKKTQLHIKVRVITYGANSPILQVSNRPLPDS